MTKVTGPLESEIQAQILQWLREHGIFAFKVIVSSPNGIPDVICCYDGKFIGLEIKRNERARIAPLQWRRKDEIEDAGGESYIVWSVDMVKEIFESHDKSEKKAKYGQSAKPKTVQKRR